MYRKRAKRRAGLIVLAAAALSLLAWEHIQATRYGYQVERSRAKMNALRASIMSQELEWQKALSPAQLAAHARTRLGMRPAGPEDIRILEEGAAPEADTRLARALARRVLNAIHRAISRADGASSPLKRPT